MEYTLQAKQSRLENAIIEAIDVYCDNAIDTYEQPDIADGILDAIECLAKPSHTNNTDGSHIILRVWDSMTYLLFPPTFIEKLKQLSPYPRAFMHLVSNIRLYQDEMYRYEQA